MDTTGTRERSISATELALVLAFFILLTIVMTGPLAFRMANHLPLDKGDPLLNTWILTWGWNHLGQLFSGYFHGNIFFPHAYTVAYSEHLLASVLLGFPIYMATKNSVLTYNFILLFSFVVSGIGMYLLTRHLTGSKGLGILSGTIFAFCPFRFDHLGHLQLLTTQWIPFTFLYLHIFFQNPRIRYAMLFTLFFLLEALSCGYYALFLILFIGCFIIYFLIAEARFTNRTLLAGLALSAAISAAVILPLYHPYAQVRQVMGFHRTFTELSFFSADITGYLSVPPFNRLWWRVLLPFLRAEGQLFFGLIPMGCFISLLILHRRRRPATTGSLRLILPRTLLVALRVMILIGIAAVILIKLTGGFTITVGAAKLDAHHLQNPISITVVLIVLLLLADVRSRGRILAFFRGFSLSKEARFYLLLFLIAILFSFGPVIRLNGQPLATGPYEILYRYFPGFDNLRVPARFGLFAMFALSILASYGAREILRRISRPLFQYLLLGCLTVLLCVEFYSVPFPLRRIRVNDEIPPVYKWLGAKQEEFAILELPVGDVKNFADFEYVYYSTYHWKNLINGTSGYFPPAYQVIRDRMQTFPSKEAIEVLRALRPRYVILHSAKFRLDRLANVRAELGTLGNLLRLVEILGGDFVYELNPAAMKQPTPSEDDGDAAEPVPREGWVVRANRCPADAALAIDGDPETRWHTGGHQEPGVRFELDMGAAHTIRGVSLGLGKYWHDYPRGCVVEVSLDAVRWQAVVDEQPGAIALRSLVRSPLTPAVELRFEPMMARYLRLSLTSQTEIYYWSITEVDVLSASPL